MDGATGQRVPGLTLSSRNSVDGGAPKWTSDNSGEIRVEGERRVFLLLHTPGFRLIHPNPEVVLDGKPREFHVVRTTRVFGMVSLERPDAKTEKEIKVVAAPVGSGKQGEGQPEWGTAAWYAQHAHREYERRVRADGGRFDIEVPAFAQVAVAAHAPGHLTRWVIVNAASAQPGGVEAILALPVCKSVTLRILDPSGRPATGVPAQLLAIREFPRSEYDEHLERVVRGVTGIGSAGLVGKETVRMKYTVAGRSRAAGLLRLEHAIEGDRYVLLVQSAGCDPVMQEVTREKEDLGEISLRAARKPLPAYKLLFRGSQVTSGALFLTEQIEWMTPSLPAMEATKEGLFPSGSLIPGREYRAVLVRDPKSAPLTGVIVFGEAETVDVSHFEE